MYNPPFIYVCLFLLLITSLHPLIDPKSLYTTSPMDIAGLDMGSEDSEFEFEFEEKQIELGPSTVPMPVSHHFLAVAFINN